MATDVKRTPTLRKSKSLKNLLSRTRKAPPSEDEELLPFRPVKQKYAQIHVTSDDITLRPLRPSTAGPEVPDRNVSFQQRNTWPNTPQERRPGTQHFDIPPHLVRTQWELDRHRSRSYSVRKPPVDAKPLPRWLFEHLPREIYDCICEQLETLHRIRNVADAVGFQTDLKALLLANKRWHRVAREHMYREIWLPSNEELPRKPRSMQRSRTRLKLLLRTLSESQPLAYMVRHLRVTADLACSLDGLHGGIERRATFDLLGEIINRCHNLELFSGYSPSVRDTVSTKLFVPLALRQNLKAHAWNLQGAQLGDDLLPAFDPGDLLDCHDDWRHLETLVLCSDSTLRLGLGTISAILQRLPSLKHLMLSKLSRRDFHNGTLLSLPALRSLRLEHLEGLTDRGIDQLAYMRPACSLEHLSLIGLELTSLHTIQSLMSHLSKLQAFTFVQDTSPEPSPDMQAIKMEVKLESPTLQYLHWDALVAGSGPAVLAKGIANGRFPSLRKVKVPCDYDGAIQALCRPIALNTLDARDLELIDRFNGDRYERFLRLSQIQAQLRARESRREPCFNVVIHDPKMRVSATHVIGTFLGDMESKIEYSLEPDVEDSHYALVDFGDIEAPKWVYESANEMERSVLGEQVLDLGMLF
ncbi:hypothetical protein BAUCODRAFT_265064 [Baudoinia panamericana UAMH 10762]|uniref:F-box domain-containing protein n=1 Tax=Baudoinia panamericana (strain UAMH 10762) TaxID=717646 RepID=M2N2I0_BAUPA|nr:uncharacterized protein BAUCODRAFT_265064 [Baudoinia panamericana UAMH 10762]EMC92875.1 hypothetical protein BAUCODRAFT_265064 [Baudoinia panamericana UAMH 10762]